MYKKKELIYRFFRGPIRDILRAVDGNSQLGAFILAIITVDYLTYFYKPGRPIEHHGKYFKAIFDYFIKINPQYSQQNVDIKDVFWNIRNKLVHAYGTFGGAKYEFSLSHQTNYPHLKYADGRFQINTTSFISELIVTAILIIDKMEQSDCEEVIDKFLKSNNPKIISDLAKLKNRQLNSIIACLDCSYDTINKFENVNIEELRDIEKELNANIHKRYERASDIGSLNPIVKIQIDTSS